MKKYLLGLLIFSSLPSLASNDSNLLKDLYTGTQISFDRRVDLKQGQKSLLVGDRKCTLRFANTALGKKHIEKDDTLVVSHVKVEPERSGSNPSTGAPIRILENIEIRFKGIKSRITCRKEGALSLSVEDLESDGILVVEDPKDSERFILE